MRGYARKRDDNEAAIVKALRAAGASVKQLDGAGVPDLIVGHNGYTYLLEVKVPSRLDGKAHTRTAQGGEGELTEAQVKWWSEWRGAKAIIVRSIEEALLAIGVMPS